MRSSSSLAGLFVLTTVTLSVASCLGEDVSPSSGDPSLDASVAPDTGGGGGSVDGGSAPPTCQSDQILCNGACVAIGPANCGGCGVVCPASAPLCSAAGAAPTCVASCPPGQTKCGDQCVDTATNPSNCGACGTKCATPPNGLATCANNTCDFTCKANFHACGTECAPDDDATRCGATCKACTAPANGTATCNGACGFTCGGGLTACVAQNACANLNTDKNNCGACGKACQIATACSTGSCNVKLGSTGTLGEACVGDPTQFQAYPVTVSAPITVTSLGLNIIQWSAQYDLWIGLYANNGGKPGALVVATKALITGNGAKDLPVTATNIAAGTYWIGGIASSFFKWSCSTSAGTYAWVDNGSTALYNANAAINPAPAGTQIITGSGNWWLSGKE